MKTFDDEARDLIYGYIVEHGPSTAIGIRDGLGAVARTFPRYTCDIIRSMYQNRTLKRMPEQDPASYDKIRRILGITTIDDYVEVSQ